MRHLHVLFDSNNAAWRADSVVDLFLPDGTRTSAIFGVLKIFNSSLDELSNLENLPVAEVISVWDWGHSKRRTSLYPEYKYKSGKTQRTEEEELRYKSFINQSNILRDNLPVFGVKTFAIRGWEADDLIYGCSETITHIHDNPLIVIVSTDEDYLQLISQNVHVYSPIKKILYTQENFTQLKGISQESYLSWKILVGDSSDAINGIPGIGSKTASNLVNTYGDLTGIFSHKLDLVKSKRTAKIFTPEGLSIIFRNEKLINLRKYVDLTDIQGTLEDVCKSVPVFDSRLAKDFLIRYKFSSILMDWNNWSSVFKDVVNRFNNC